MSAINMLVGLQEGRISDFLEKLEKREIRTGYVTPQIAKAVFSQLKSKEVFLLAADEISYDRDLSLGFDLLNDGSDSFFEKNRDILVKFARNIAKEHNLSVEEHLYDETYQIGDVFSVNEVFDVLVGARPNNKSEFSAIYTRIAEWMVKESILRTCLAWNDYISNRASDAPLSA